MRSQSTLLLTDAPGQPGDRIGQAWHRRIAAVPFELAPAGLIPPFACCRRGAWAGLVHWLDSSSFHRCVNALTVPQVAMIGHFTGQDIPTLARHLAKVDAITTTSRQQRIKLEHLTDREVWHIPHTIDSQIWAPPADRDAGRQAIGARDTEFLVGFATNTRATEVNLLDQLAASARGAGLELALIQTGPDARMAGLASKHNVRLLHATGPAGIGVADAFVSAVDDTVDPYPVLAAMACGVPVVAPDSGPASELIVEGQTGLCYGKNSAPELLEKLLSLKRLPELRHRLAHAARSRIESAHDEQTALARVDFASLYGHARRHYSLRPRHEQISRRFFQSLLALQYPLDALRIRLAGRPPFSAA